MGKDDVRVESIAIAVRTTAVAGRPCPSPPADEGGLELSQWINGYWRQQVPEVDDLHNGELHDAEASTMAEEPLLQNFHPKEERRDRTVYGLCLYGLSSCFLATMLVFAKKLGQWDMSVFEILLARSAALALFSLGGCWWDGVNPLGRRRGLLLVRGIFGFGAIGNYLFAVTLLPLNDTLVLTFTAPIWAALLTPLLIKERVNKVVGIAILFCMAGVALITQPRFLGFPDKGRVNALGVFFALFQALCSALAKTCVRELRKESPHVSVFYLSWVSLLGATVGCAAPRAFGQQAFRLPNHWVETVLLLGVGLTSYGSQICMTNALRHAKAAPALAMSYISIVFTITYGYFIFNEVPTVLSICGAVLICASTFWLGVFTRTHPEPPSRAASAALGLPKPDAGMASVNNSGQQNGALHALGGYQPLSTGGDGAHR